MNISIYRLILCLGAAFFICVPGMFGAVPADEHWDSQFGSVGTSDELWSLAVVGGKIYVGGIFVSAGNTKANYVAGYDGTNWFPLNGGVAGSLNETYVFSLASDGTNLYAGGFFTNVDDCGAQFLAEWNGTNWSPIAGGSPGSIVEAVKIAGTNVFVGGLFTNVGSVSANCIAQWTGSSWRAFGTGVTGGTFPVISAIEYDGTNLYVGGSFTQAGSMNASNVAVWNGTAWSGMGTGLGGGVTALMSYGGFIYAGGAFTNTSLGITNIARWNGNAWSAVGTGGANGVVRCFTSDGTNLYIGGDFTLINGMVANRIVKMNGNTWTTLGAGVQGFGEGTSPGVYKMTFDAQGRLIVAGNFNQVNGVGVSHVAAWDGTNWFALGSATSKGMSHFVGQVIGLYYDGTNLYAGGVFTEAGNLVVDGTAEWNGTNWSALGPVVDGQLPFSQSRAFVRVGNELYAGGTFTNIGGIAAGRIAQWDGSNWHDIGDADGTVRAVMYDGTFVWAAGSFTNIGGVFSPGVALYWVSEGFWVSVGAVSGGSQLADALAWDGTNMYLGGSFTSVNGVSANNIAVYNGSQWNALATGVNGTVDAIAVTNGTAYAGGSFTTAGGNAANAMAKWNGTNWSALGGGLTGSLAAVDAILISGSNVYTAGTFSNAGGIYSGGIADWNGSAWMTLGSGLSNNTFNGPGTSMTLALAGNDLFVGGNFTFAGDKPSEFIARWNSQSNFYPTATPLLTRETRLTNGLFQFRVTGTGGQSYTIQGSTNLSAWTPLQTNSIMFYDYTDTAATNFRTRFYRAIVTP